MHLSHPTGHSVNDGIPVKEFSLKYISVDTAMDAAMMLGCGAIMAKVDVKAAFRLCPIRPEDWPTWACVGTANTSMTRSSPSD